MKIRRPAVAGLGRGWGPLARAGYRPSIAPSRVLHERPMTSTSSHRARPGGGTERLQNHVPARAWRDEMDADRRRDHRRRVAAANQRPELFRAVIQQAGAMDM